MKLLAALALSASLAGCSIGISPGQSNPSKTFSVSVGYQEAFRRAENSARECHAGSNPLMRAKYVSGNVFTDTGKASMRINMEGWSNDMARLEFTRENDSDTLVKVTVYGATRFDQGEIDALEAAIKSGNTVCRTPQYKPPL